MMKVVEMYGQPNQPVIRLLENILEDAKAGKAVALALVYIDDNGITTRGATWRSCASGGYLELLGAISRLQWKLIQDGGQPGGSDEQN